MERRSKKAKILIVEDDTTFSSSLVRQLKAAGYRSEAVTRPEQAIEKCEDSGFDVILIDCLLPGMSGVDLGQRVREIANTKSSNIVFMSGIYTDKKFVREAMQTDGAVGFFEKPFETNELIHLLNSHFKSKSSSPQKRLHELLEKPKASSREKRRAIEALEKVHGFDLPLIFSLLVETRSSGHLNIVSEGGVVSGISFSKGLIVNVDVADAETYIGRLLINHGYIRPVDLESVLSSVNQRKIGERLIQANLLSPHALGIALAEQMNIRLSRTIVPGSIELNFVPCEVPPKEPYIDPDDFVEFLRDWIQSKLSFEWLRTLYHYWGGHSFIKGPGFADCEKVLSTANTKQLIDELLSGKTLDEILENNKKSGESFLRYVHLLVMKRVVVFREREKKGDDAEQAKSLRKFKTEMQNKNHLQLFEMLGAGHDEIEESAERCLVEFKQWLKETGNDKDPSVSRLKTELLARVQEAYNIVSEKEALAAYRKKMGEDAVQEKLTVQRLIEDAKGHLRASQFKKAFELLEQAKKSSPSAENIRLYYIWAKIGVSDFKAQPAKIGEIESEMLTIPPEERYSALYAYVQGVLHKASGQKSLAKKAFEKAIFMDPKMIEAKREINMMSVKANSPKKDDIFNRDIRDIFSSFFKKKKSS